MKIAVTAASGKLGAEIVQALLKEHKKEDIVALARTPEKAEFLGVEVRKGDYNDFEELKNSLQGIDAVLLVSGMDTPDKRIPQHRNVIQAAKEAGVKKIVYTSIQGAEEDTAFSPIVASNRKTEADVQASGLEYVIGRNGIYIEPDVEYIENYKKDGAIKNCAGDGKCGYTTRGELAFAYSKMLTQYKHNGKIYNLHGKSITQTELANYLNTAFGTDLVFENMSVEAYKVERIAELGEFIGTVIAGIYEGIKNGAVDNKSDYKEAAGREHISWEEYFENFGK